MMELKQAFWILRHGSGEGLREYLKAIKTIEDNCGPVTRCKACANFRQNSSGACWCNEYGGAITPNDYCSRAVSDKQPRASIPWEAD